MAKRTSSFDDLVTKLMQDPEFVKEHERQKTICAMWPEAHKEERPIEKVYKGLGICMPCFLELTKEPKSRHIIFTQDSILAIQNGYKRMTRRVVKPQPPNNVNFALIRSAELQMYADRPEGRLHIFDEHKRKCPYGTPGDRLWVREPWAIAHTSADTWKAEVYVTIVYKDGQEKRTDECIYDDLWGHWWI